MSRHHKGRSMREFGMLNSRYVGKNYMKYFKLVVKDMTERYNIKDRDIIFMLYAYDCEFFTGNYMADQFFTSREGFKERVLWKLQRKGFIGKAFSKKDAKEPTSMTDAVFHQENKQSYKSRYTLTQKARLLVQQFYRKMEGQEEIKFTVRQLKDGRDVS